MLLTTFHTLGYFVLWLHTSLESLVEELFSAHAIGGLDPWCTENCTGVSNLAGLIACGSLSRAPSWWRHSSPPRPPGAGSPGSWRRDARGMRS